MIQIRSQRLELRAATREIVLADLEDRAALSGLLGAVVPADWPPPSHDETAMKWVLDRLTIDRPSEGWLTWYLIADSGGERRAVGIAGYKGAPSADGTVEIGYSVVESEQRRGYASEAVRRLMEWAFGQAGVKRIIAETYPHLRPSIRVLEKCGFTYIGEGSALLVIRFEMERDSFPALPNVVH
jgi:ribosomal-protein-alanine N-acetyltransferase